MRLILNNERVSAFLEADLLHEEPDAFQITVHRGDGSRSADWHHSVPNNSVQKATSPSAWPRNYRRNGDSIEVCLNLGGRAEIKVEGMRLLLEEERVGIYDYHQEKVKTRRNCGYDHRFTIISLKKNYLQDSLAECQFLLRSDIRSAIYEPESSAPLCLGKEMLERDQRWLRDAQQVSSVPPAGRSLWYKSKVMEFVAAHFFTSNQHDGELFCHRVKRQNVARILETKRYLHQHFREPFCLTALSEKIGCSRGHLSKVFSQETGKTLKGYVRSLRVLEAHRMLLSGRYNVTESAFECGYNSLSHFTKAFVEEFGYKPSELKREA